MSLDCLFDLREVLIEIFYCDHRPSNEVPLSYRLFPCAPRGKSDACVHISDGMFYGRDIKNIVQTLLGFFSGECNVSVVLITG